MLPVDPDAEKIKDPAAEDEVNLWTSIKFVFVSVAEILEEFVVQEAPVDTNADGTLSPEEATAKEPSWVMKWGTRLARLGSRLY